MLRRVSIYAVMTVAVIAVMTPSVSYAQQFPPAIVPAACGGPDAATQCDLCQLTQLARNLMNFAIFFAVVMAAVLFSWAGIKYLTNNGNVGQTKMATEMLRNVFFGLLIVLCAWLVINTLMTFMVAGTTGSGNWMPWNQICSGVPDVSIAGGP